MPKSLIARPSADDGEERVMRRLAVARRTPKDMIVRTGIVESTRRLALALIT